MSQFFINGGSGGGGTPIETINGDVGSVSGSTVTVFANYTPDENSGSTVEFTAISGTQLQLNVTDSLGNTFIGKKAGSVTTTATLSVGLGFQCLSSITDGVQNVAIGYNAMNLLTDGTSNTGCGYGALASVVDGSNNAAFGDQALTANTGSNNTAVGSGCLSGADADNNTAMGYLAARSITSGTENTIVGFIALVNGGAASYNTALGHQALTNCTGNSNTAIGHNAGANYSGTETNNINLGYNAQGTASENNATHIGNSSTATCQVYGIYGNTPSSPQMVVSDSSGNLGSQAIPSGGFAAEFKTGMVAASNQTAVTVPFIASNPSSAMASTVNSSNTSLYLVPIYLDESKTYTALGCLVTNAPGAGSTVDFVLYDNRGTGGLPGNLVASAVNVGSTIASITEGTISYAASIGWYWIGIQRNATATVTIRGYSNGDDFSSLTNKAFYNPSNPTSTNFETIAYFGATNTYGTYPNNPTLTQNQPSNTVPLIYIR